MPDKPSIDRDLFESLKTIVDTSLAVCVIAGDALRTMRDREMYKLDGFKSWSDFLAARYSQWTIRYCNQLIVDAKTINELPEKFRKLITSHSAAREIAKIPESLRSEVIEIATVSATVPATAAAIKKSSGPPKAKKQIVAPAKRIKLPVAKEKGPCDKTGIEIPVEILPLWNRGHEAGELIAYISRVVSAIGKAQEENDPLYLEVGFSAVAAHLSQAAVELQLAIPCAVCPECNGKMVDGCVSCKGRGFVSEFFYKLTAVEKRRMRPLFIGSAAEKKEVKK